MQNTARIKHTRDQRDSTDIMEMSAIQLQPHTSAGMTALETNAINWTPHTSIQNQVLHAL